MVNFAQVSSVPSPCLFSEEQSPMCVSHLVAMTLEKIISENAQCQTVNKLMLNDPFVKFQSSYEPDVSVEYYIQRIFKHSKCSDSCLIIMLVYIDRLIENHGLILTMLNAHRVIITSLMVAAKYHDDLFYNNAYFAKLGGIPLAELNMLEVEFLQMLDFSMFVDTFLFEKYQLQLQNFQSFIQAQYSPRSTACHPAVASPYRSQCENAFQFSPHRFASSEQGYYMQNPTVVGNLNHNSNNHNSPVLVEYAPTTFIFPATCHPAATSFPSPDAQMYSTSSIWPTALTNTVTTTQPSLQMMTHHHPPVHVHHPRPHPHATMLIPVPCASAVNPLMLVSSVPVPVQHPHAYASTMMQQPQPPQHPHLSFPTSQPPAFPHAMSFLPNCCAAGTASHFSHFPTLLTAVSF